MNTLVSQNDGLPSMMGAVTRFAQDRVAHHAPDWSCGHIGPEAALFREAGALGLMRLSVPTVAGGLGLGLRARVAVISLLAAQDFGFAMAVINSHNVALRLARSATADVQARVLPGLLDGSALGCTAITEPAAGSDITALGCTATPARDGWRLTGEKVWIINARRARWALVYARVSGGVDLTAFLVDLDSPGVTRAPCDSALSQQSIGSGALQFKDVRLAAEAMILAPDGAWAQLLAELNIARAYVAAMCGAMLRAALDETTCYGQDRHSFGKPLAAHQGWRLPLARAATDLAATEALTEAALAAFDEPSGVGTSEHAQLRAAQAKVHAVAQCQRHLPRLLQAQGAQGHAPVHVTPRHLAAVQAAALTDGAEDILLERIARLAGISGSSRDGAV